MGRFDDDTLVAAVEKGVMKAFKRIQEEREEFRRNLPKPTPQECQENIMRYCPKCECRIKHILNKEDLT